VLLPELSGNFGTIPLFSTGNRRVNVGVTETRPDSETFGQSVLTESQSLSAPPVTTTVRSTRLTAIPKFTHSFDGTGNWAAFLSLFEISAANLQWSDREASLALIHALTGQALAVVPMLPPPHLTRGEDYQGLRQHLTSSFCCGKYTSCCRLRATFSETTSS